VFSGKHGKPEGVKKAMSTFAEASAPPLSDVPSIVEA